jgi:hypothetical protein
MKPKAERLWVLVYEGQMYWAGLHRTRRECWQEAVDGTGKTMDVLRARGYTVRRCLLTLEAKS